MNDYIEANYSFYQLKKIVSEIDYLTQTLPKTFFLSHLRPPVLLGKMELWVEVVECVACKGY